MNITRRAFSQLLAATPLAGLAVNLQVPPPLALTNKERASRAHSLWYKLPSMDEFEQLIERVNIDRANVFSDVIEFRFEFAPDSEYHKALISLVFEDDVEDSEVFDMVFVVRVGGLTDSVSEFTFTGFFDAVNIAPEGLYPSEVGIRRTSPVAVSFNQPIA